MARNKRRKIGNPVKRAVYERDGWACTYCRLRFDPNHKWSHKTVAPYISDETGQFAEIFLEIDHIVPLCLGGTDDIDNLCAACTRCNNRKRSNTAESMRIDA